MVEIPEDAVVENGYAVYLNEYQGKKYLNIRKIYQDRDTGQDAIGKGLTIAVDKFAAVATAAQSFLAGE